MRGRRSPGPVQSGDPSGLAEALETTRAARAGPRRGRASRLSPRPGESPDPFASTATCEELVGLRGAGENAPREGGRPRASASHGAPHGTTHGASRGAAHAFPSARAGLWAATVTRWASVSSAPSSPAEARERPRRQPQGWAGPLGQRPRVAGAHGVQGELAADARTENQGARGRGSAPCPPIRFQNERSPAEVSDPLWGPGRGRAARTRPASPRPKPSSVCRGRRAAEGRGTGPRREGRAHSALGARSRPRLKIGPGAPGGLAGDNDTHRDHEAVLVARP